MSILLRVEAFKDLVQEVVDKGVHTVEQIHQTIATAPLDAMKQGGMLDEQRAQALKQKQAAAIGQVYGVIRRVNKEVGDFASAVIESLENHADAQHNIGRKDDEAPPHDAGGSGDEAPPYDAIGRGDEAPPHDDGRKGGEAQAGEGAPSEGRAESEGAPRGGAGG